MPRYNEADAWRYGAGAKYDPADDEDFWESDAGRALAEELENDPHADEVWRKMERRMPDYDEGPEWCGDAPPW